MIKVTNTKIHKLPLFNTFGQDQGTINIPVVEAELVLIECNAKEGLIAKSTVNDKVWIKRLETPGTPAKYYKPILISKTETIEKGDWIYDELENNYFQCSFPFSNKFRYDKILALPQHFSIELLNLIVNNKIKHGDKLLIECWEYGQKEVLPPISLYQIKLDTSNHVMFHSLMQSDEQFVLQEEEVSKVTRGDVRLYLLRFAMDNGIDLQIAKDWFKANVK